MATQKEIEEQEIDTYIIYNKLAEETDPKIRADLQKKYDGAMTRLEKMESSFNVANKADLAR